jgi:hypothetical protein
MDIKQRVSEMIELEVERRVKMQVEEVTRQMNEKLNAYIQNISATHGINIQLLLRDVPTLAEDNDMCRGLKKDGTRCTRIGKFHGFCQIHLYQREHCQPVEMRRSSSHIHDHTILYQHDCPACNPLIDLNDVLNK